MKQEAESEVDHEPRGHARPKLLSPTPRRRKRRRHFSAWQSEWSRKPLCTVVLGTLLIAAPQLLGGLLPWTVNAIAALSLLSLAVVGQRAPALERHFPRFGLVMLAVTGWTALQATPLPCGFVSLLAPDSVAKQRAIDAIMDLAPSALCTISQEPANTQQEVVKALSLTATFISVWAFVASGGSRRLFSLIAGSSLALSVVALAHGLFEWDRVFGLYEPVGLTRTWLLSPLMNPNNQGAFAALGAPMWIGLSYREPNPNRRLLGYTALALTSTAAILSMSRGAISQLLAGFVVMGAVIVYQRLKKQATGGRRHASMPMAGLVALLLSGAGGLGLGIYLVGSDVMREFEGIQLDKIDLVQAALRFAVSHPLVGVGRGAFGSAFVSAEGANARYRFAENFVAHWAAEWGIPMTLALLVAIGWTLYKHARPGDSVARAGALTALILFAGQNLLDFGFELLGVATIAIALFAACVAPSPDAISHTEAKDKLLPYGPQITLGTVCVGVAALVWLGPRLERQSVPALSQQLRSALASSDRAKFRGLAIDALQLHPSEPVLTLLVATESQRHNDPKTPAWLNRSMMLAPKWARPHQMAFRWLWQQGSGEQALLELKLAAAVNMQVALQDICRLGRVDASWALAAIPRGEQRRRLMESTSLCLSGSPTSQAFNSAVLREFPEALHPLLQEGNRLASEGQTDQALALLERAQRAHPRDYRPSLLRFRALLNAGRLHEVLDAIDATLLPLSEDERAPVLEVKAFALARAGSPEFALQTVQSVRQLARTNPDKLAESYALEGRVRLELGQPGSALSAYREAYRVNEDPSYLERVAKLAESLGDHAQALWAYVQLCERDPRGTACERRRALLAPAPDNSGR